MIDFTNMTNNPKHESKCETAIINHCKGIYCFVFDGGFYCGKYWHHRDTQRLFVCLHLCFSVYVGHGVRCNRNSSVETAAVGLGQFLNVLSCFAGLFRRSNEQVANACLTIRKLTLLRNRPVDPTRGFQLLFPNCQISTQNASILPGKSWIFNKHS